MHHAGKNQLTREIIHSHTDRQHRHKLGWYKVQQRTEVRDHGEEMVTGEQALLLPSYSTCILEQIEVLGKTL